jgi:phage N-6-adenine-methyltransferase
VNQTSFLPPAPEMPMDEPNERYTPSSVFQQYHREFGFTLDACATKESAKCPRFFDRQDNGLIQSWGGERVWCNPPYDDIESWVRKAEAEMYLARRPADLVVMLLPAWTDREWWWLYIEAHRDGRSRWRPIETRFPRGRIRFGYPGNPEGLGPSSPNFWNVFLIFRPSMVPR